MHKAAPRLFPLAGLLCLQNQDLNKMKNKNTLTLIAGVLVLAGGYLLFKYFKKPTGPKDPLKPTEPVWIDYVVSTSISNLNLRQSPSLGSPVIGKLAKGSIVKAKRDSDEWFAITEDNGATIKGYASSQYLVKK